MARGRARLGAIAGVVVTRVVAVWPWKGAGQENTVGPLEADEHDAGTVAASANAPNAATTRSCSVPRQRLRDLRPRPVTFGSP